MIILIPAYEPDDRLISLINEIKINCAYKIIVVDDGSGEKYKAVFEQVKNMGCIILSHIKNMGKGCALKTGFEYISNVIKECVGVVTADADGQHLAKDILRISAMVDYENQDILLGVRKFVGKVPLKSAFGNMIARNAFTLFSGVKLFDTQTGLRGFSTTLLPWLLKIKGERFEYEMNMLLQAGKAGYKFNQIEIETIYDSSNKSTHFRAIEDSISVLTPFFKFCASGISAASIDYFLLFFVQWLTQNLFLAVVIARVVSSGVNFAINKFMVFNTNLVEEKTKSELLQYYFLVVILLFANYFLLSYFSQSLMISLFWSKILTELMLFSISFTVQKLFIFKR